MIWGYPNDLGTIMNHPYQNINPTDCGWNKLWYGLIVVKLTIINPNYIVLKCLEVITQYSYSPDSSLSPHWGAPPCGWGRAPDGNRRRFLQVSPTWTYLFGDIWRPLPYYVWIYQSYSITINLMWSDLDIYIYIQKSIQSYPIHLSIFQEGTDKVLKLMIVHVVSQIVKYHAIMGF